MATSLLERDIMIQCLIATGSTLDQAQLQANAFFQTNPTYPYQNTSQPPSLPLLFDQAIKAQQYNQKTAITLLAQVVAFSGTLGVRFEDWIQHFEACLAVGTFPDDMKILLLRPKLTGTAADALIQFQRQNTGQPLSYDSIKKALHQRFHGNETHRHYAEQLKNCVHLDKESIRDYASRLTKLYQYSYPDDHDATTGVPVDTRSKKMLIDRFQDGLSQRLQNKIGSKEFTDMEKLIKYVEGFIKADQKKESTRQAEAYIRAVKPLEAMSSPHQTQQDQDFKREMADIMAMLNDKTTRMHSIF